MRQPNPALKRKHDTNTGLACSKRIFKDSARRIGALAEPRRFFTARAHARGVIHFLV